MPPFIGEIRMFAGTFAPAGWMFCQGQTLPISENDALFTLIGTTYGGDGEETFNLPDLRGRVPIHMGTGAGLSSYTIGESGGVESVTLTIQQIPNHTHTLLATNDFAQSSGPGNGILGRSQTADPYNTDKAGAPAAMNPSSVSPVGGSQPHENMQPYLAIHFILSLFGEFPD